MQPSELYVDYKKFSGINKLQSARIDTYRTPVHALLEAENVDIDRTGMICSRDGRVLIKAGNFHSMKSFGNTCLIVQEGILKILNKDYTLTQLKTGLSDARVSYWYHDDKIYLTNTRLIGYVAENVYNEFPIFTYGITKPALLSYFQKTKKNMPAGQLIAMYDNRLYVAVGNELWFSDPMAFHRTTIKKGFIKFKSYINLLLPVTDGIFVADDTTYFLSGKNPKEFTMGEKSPYGAILYSADEVTNQFIGLQALGVIEPQAKYFMWRSSVGSICLGGDGGFFRDLTIKKYPAIEGLKYGTGVFRQITNIAENKNIYQYLSVVEK